VMQAIQQLLLCKGILKWNTNGIISTTVLKCRATAGELKWDLAYLQLMTKHTKQNITNTYQDFKQIKTASRQMGRMARANDIGASRGKEHPKEIPLATHPPH